MARPKRITAAGAQACARCGKVKPLDQFSPAQRGRPSGWCKTCCRVWAAEYRRTEQYRAWAAGYLALEDVQERQRRRCAVRRRTAAYQAHQAAYRASARGKLVHSRALARWNLKQTADPARTAAIEARIAAIERELARMDEV